ncbi:coiled-coil and C2 domain-containing protein 2A isoform X1 [Rhagoletis pomonella]|uniref:coiled-coil and C2 domain-containing protein 2A isoform X1 n=1 Tax=Rhagoletis pomonella TaxID=28610 RepID=UPI00177EE4EA|nr:coiled-coil and C2 domain-containing protein 2A isoform X1 [Rhagoletis pomonella]XP_036333675.1 coiled-coil and C2 domain-containing protein 2A isoform X1 [Rhagoletis pomonella]
MSGRQAQRRKKQAKGKRLKNQTQTSRTKSKRRKSRPSREYQDNEREVQLLLENTSLSIDSSPQSRHADELVRSLDFFCRNNEEELIQTASSATRKLKLKREHIQRQRDSYEGSIDENAEEAEEDASQDDLTSADTQDDDASSGSEHTASAASTQQREHTASTYIQVDEDVLVRLRAADKFMQDPTLLFKPGTTLMPDIALAARTAEDAGKLKSLRANTCRMLNRYQAERRARDEPVCKELVEQLKRVQSGASLYMKDRTLYRSFCTHKFHTIFCEPTRQPDEIPTRKFVRIYLKELLFTAHPHLLEEHRISNELEELYEQYAHRQQERVCEKLRAQLQTERRVVNELLQRESNSSAELELASTKERRARKLEQQLHGVRALRNTLYEEEARSKRLLKDILDIWVRLKQLRKTQAYQSTRFKLRIRVEEDATNAAAESHRWAERFETDLNEIYREELEIYYRAKRLWKSRDRKADLAELPVKPRKPDITQLSTELRAKLAECLCAPGEPKIHVQLHRVCNEEFYNLPGLRRLKSFFMKIYFDGEFVSATRSYRIEPDLRLPMNEVFGVFLERRMPRDIRVALYEKFRLHAARKVVDIQVPVPHALQTADTEEQRVTFDTQKLPKVSGRLTIRFQCEEQTDFGARWHVPSITTAAASLTSSPSNRARARKWQAEHLLAEFDENVSHVDEDETTTEAAEPTERSLTEPIRTCTFEEELLQFCAVEELENNRRYKLLRSRYLKNDARTRDLRFIAPLDNELEFDWPDKEEAVIEAGDWMDAIDLHKHEGKKYLKELYEAIRSQCARLSTAAASVEQLLIGDVPASWSTFFQALSLIFNPKRTLRAPLSQQPVVTHALSLDMNACQNFRIVLNVVRATGIPVRMPSSADSESKERSNESPNMFVSQLYKYSNVRPFIALSYKDKFCRSLTVEGSNPTWNEQLILELSGSLADLREDLKISLFDEVVENHVNEDLSVRNMDIYQRIQTNWLGEYRFPIHALLSQQKVCRMSHTQFDSQLAAIYFIFLGFQLEGVLELNTPKVLLGYKQPTLEHITSQADVNITIEQFPEIKETVRLWYYMSIEPHITLPRLNTACLECAELKEVRRQLQQWCLQVQELRPQRYIEPLVCTAEGKRVCLTRLLEPVPLPLETSEHQLELVCRFVAQLNVLKGFDPCASFEGIWLNNQCVLDTNWGTVKDLGVLLCNFLLSIGLSCWLVLGFAAAYGECAFVLFRSEEGELLLIDPYTAKRYGTRDVFCPLYKICLVVAQDNLYCNIQAESRVTMTNYNFNDASFWLPAFSKRNPAPLGGVQKLNYSYQLSCNTFELKRNIERKVMKKINSWRAMRKTIWNRAFQPRLQSILQNLEQFCTSGNGSYAEAKYADQIAAEFPNYKIYGYALNFPYTNLTSISERIKSTGIHLNTDKRVEFCLATHIHIYPNDVLSVWIFLISVIPNRF